MTEEDLTDKVLWRGPHEHVFEVAAGEWRREPSDYEIRSEALRAAVHCSDTTNTAGSVLAKARMFAAWLKGETA